MEIQVNTGYQKQISTGSPDEQPFLEITFIVVPWIIICPTDKFLIDPREQADGGVSQTISEGLGLSGLLRGVATAYCGLSLTLLEPFLLSLGVSKQKVGQKEEGSLGWMRYRSSAEL